MTRLPEVSSRFGAPMGRRQVDWNFAPGFVPHRFIHLYRIRINSGGYDDGGAYWGIGQPLYCAESDNPDAQFCKFTRAFDRTHAAERLGIPSSWLIRGESKK